MNQADPGLRRVDGNGNPAADSTTFHRRLWPEPSASASVISAAQLADILAILADNNNIVGSQGVSPEQFQ